MRIAAQKYPERPAFGSASGPAFCKSTLCRHMLFRAKSFGLPSVGPLAHAVSACRDMTARGMAKNVMVALALLDLTGHMAVAQAADIPAKADGSAASTAESSLKDAHAPEVPPSQVSASPEHALQAQPSQVPGYYRMQLGQLQITALLDGFLPLPEKTVQGINRKDLEAALRRAHVPQFTAAPLGTGMQTAVNTFLIRRGERLMLVDTGAGTCFGSSTGQLMRTLQQAGIDPASVTDVLLTHAHPDHICGLLTAQENMAFPKATVWLPDDEAAYWLDEREMARAPEEAKAAFGMATRSLAPYAKAGRVKRVVSTSTSGHEGHEGTADTSHTEHTRQHRASFGIQRVTERDLPPGVTLVPTHGHTPGHGSWLVDGKLLLWGDIVHYHAVQFARPLIHSSFDSVPKEAIASRKRLFAEAARRDWWVGGAHLPFPGLGHVVLQGRAYRWVRTEFTPLP